mmetsp:Transcript_17984/g.36330  ORF Transcript_17984/g.36330 Transcript_17984/m.36330 type:complete len:293 (-) Transcript_17984:209-1087(-)
MLRHALKPLDALDEGRARLRLPLPAFADQRLDVSRHSRRDVRTQPALHQLDQDLGQQVRIHGVLQRHVKLLRLLQQFLDAGLRRSEDEREDECEGVDVALLRAAPLEHLRSHVQDRAPDPLHVLRLARQPEVAHHRLPCSVHQHVGRLEVAVHVALTGHPRHPLANVQGQLEAAGGRESRVLAQEVREVAVGAEVGDDAELLGVDGHQPEQVGMPQASQRRHLSFEVPHHVLVDLFGLQHLGHHLQARQLRLVRGPEAAFAELGGLVHHQRLAPLARRDVQQQAVVGLQSSA